MTENNIIEFYQFTFNSIDNLTRFAEGKNAALIGFNSTIIFGLLSSIKDVNNLKFKKWTFFLFNIMIVTQLISLSIAFTSLIAKTEISSKTQMDLEKANLTFFGHICNLTPEDYYNLTISKYNMKSNNSSLEKAYAYDIVQIASITSNKFRLFNLAVKFNIATLSALILWFAGFMILSKNFKSSETTSKEMD
jgi:hypothetical protein